MQFKPIEESKLRVEVEGRDLCETLDPGTIREIFNNPH